MDNKKCRTFPPFRVSLNELAVLSAM